MIGTWFFSFLCIFTALGFLFGFCCKKEAKEGDWGPGIFISALFSVASFAGVVSHASEVLQIWIAPKVWLVEYAAGLAK